jgi:hypothetical protein
VDVNTILDAVRAAPATRGIAAGVVMYALIWAYTRRQALSTRGRWLVGLAASLLAALGLALCLRAVAANFLTLRDWDFLCFWTYGRALALGESPYDVQTLREIAAPLGPSSEFLRLNVCLYPPIFLPVCWPFGYLPFTASMVVWFAIQISALAASIVVLRSLWDAERTWLGLAVTLAIFFSWHATQLTLLYGQTNFLFLLAILGAVLPKSPVLRGYSLGIAIVVKPIAAILLIDVLLRREWRTLLAVLVPPVIAFGAFLLIQGWPGLMRFVERDPKDIDFAYYDSFFNQSLLGVLLRWFDSAPLANPIFFPPYVVLSGILTIATVVVLARLPRDWSALRMSYALILALMVYPGTQMYYSVWLFVPLALMWRERDLLVGGRWAWPLAVALTFGLGWSRWNLASHLALWLILTILFSLSRSLQDKMRISGVAAAASA